MQKAVCMTNPHGASQFDLTDEIDLRWFMGDDDHSPIFERSVMGDMLERAEQFGTTSSGCPVETKHALATRIWAHHQRACLQPLEVLTEEQFASIRSAVKELGLDADDPSLSAQITCETRTVSVRTRDETLLRYAAISRSVMRCHPAHQRALSLFYGPSGNRWVRHQLGRLLAVYELTRAGRDMLDERTRRCRRDRTSDDGGPAERFDAEWRHQRQWRDVTRGRRFKACEVEARNLLASARAEYRSACYRKAS